ncbi:2-hydroxychromene-2-carboxylate isomerase [Roseateles koreensis]|uniref:2-hydroxychromene-2-carboxylate isomerase n=1 Tax=Roseateles koreensis TaxID=2987526 RepID=A0ABT5KLY7_9BURK|nr:2-hydroxychromene-2-carboxylate isomerase [Roseateles koreensis]MDC8783926.1 2-hydroxychromene-2-carboxylate isomerase [Roseateles koreensis]
MKHLRFYFDPISPYAALAFERLPEALQGCSYSVEYRPILFAALLHAIGQKGPAEIESKRQWTFRQIAWTAHKLGIPLQVPASHPFNPLPLLRLAWACAPVGGTPNRLTVETIFRHVWQGEGADANAEPRLQALQEVLEPQRDPASEAVKEDLRTATEAALNAGVFGVPTIEVDGRMFWGQDSLDMLAAYLRGDPWFEQGEWEAAARPRPGVRRGTH